MNPRARHDELLSIEVVGETLVYDTRADRAHVLNPAAALVWRHADGRASLPDLAALLEDRLGLPADEEAAQLAVDALRDAGLLADGESEVERPTRRQVLRRLGRTGAAAALLPAVTSMAVPRPAAAASGNNTKSRGYIPDPRRRRLPPGGRDL